MLEKALKRSGVATRSLALEITESSTARNNTAIETIRVLRQRGHRVYIDDFGTGYSSLSYLHALSIDAIKIDKSFIQTIGTEAVTGCILPQILSMAQALSLEVILEGIETQEQLNHFSEAHLNLLAPGWPLRVPGPPRRVPSQTGLSAEPGWGRARSTTRGVRGGRPRVS